MSDNFTEVGKIAEIVDKARRSFDSGRTRPLKWRKEQLNQLRRMLKENEALLQGVLAEDLGVNEFFSTGVELENVHLEINSALQDLNKWTAPEHVSLPLVVQPGSAYIQREPYGLALIISPWNYPVSLILSPMVSAIAAGNAIVYKPSEVSERTTALLQRLLPQYLDQEAIVGIFGAVKETQELLKHKFDFICYTGNKSVARIVYQAAVPHLTPLLLELGGKCPAIVASDADLTKSVKRLVWGKWTMNAGQTCLSPDYIITTPGMEAKLIPVFRKVLEEFYGANPKECKDYSRIINQRHTKRLLELLETKDSEILIGGTAQADISARYIPPTIVRAQTDSKIMDDEIFGPILPIVTVPDIEAAIRYINEHDKPLGLYVFTNSSSIQKKVLAETSSGSACVNDCVIQGGVPSLPFGGVGPSGMGSYHTKFGFDQFSHKKAIVIKKGADVPLRFPPYTPTKLKWIKRLRSVTLTVLIPVVIVTFAIIAGGIYKIKY